VSTSEIEAQGEDHLVGHPLAGWVVAGVAAVIATAAIALRVVSDVPVDIDAWYFVVDASDAFIFGVAGAVMLARRRHAVPIIFLVTAVGGAVAAFGFSYGHYAAMRSDLVGLRWIEIMQNVAWRPGTYALFTIVPWLVVGTLRRRPLAWACIGASSVLIVIDTFDPLTAGATYTVGPSPIHIDSAWRDSLALWSSTTGGKLLVLLGVVAVLDLLWRLRWGPEEERPGLGWLAIGTSLVAAAFIPVAWHIPWVYEHLTIAFTPVLHLLSQAFFPGAVLAVVLRQRLWGIELTVNRYLVWSLLTGIVAGSYVLVVFGATELVGGNGRVAGLVTTIGVAIGIQPLRDWVQRHVDRITYGDATDRFGVVVRLGERLGSAEREEDLLRGLAETVRDSFRLGSVTVESQEGERLAVVGDPAGAPLVVPLRQPDRVTGRLLVTGRAGEHLDRRTEDGLRDLAPVLAIAVSSALLAGEIRRSRAALVTAREEERQVLRRELHDGLGPALAGLGLGLHASSNLLEADPDAAAELLGRLEGELDHCVEDVRRISRDLRPVILDEMGLVPALEQLAERQRDAGMEVEVVAPDLPDLSAAVSGAVYRIVGEALLNARRHGDARSCQVRLHAGHDLVVEVADDGRGIDDGARPGVGLTSMGERASELGGAFEVEARPGGGTLVRVQLPLEVRA
jgi:signal transduction histidine kinase